MGFEKEAMIHLQTTSWCFLRDQVQMIHPESCSFPCKSCTQDLGKRQGSLVASLLFIHDLQVPELEVCPTCAIVSASTIWPSFQPTKHGRKTIETTCIFLVCHWSSTLPSLSRFSSGPRCSKVNCAQLSASPLPSSSYLLLKSIL